MSKKILIYGGIVFLVLVIFFLLRSPLLIMSTHIEYPKDVHKIGDRVVLKTKIINYSLLPYKTNFSSTYQGPDITVDGISSCCSLAGDAITKVVIYPFSFKSFSNEVVLVASEKDIDFNNEGLLVKPGKNIIKIDWGVDVKKKEIVINVDPGSFPK